MFYRLAMKRADAAILRVAAIQVSGNFKINIGSNCLPSLKIAFGNKTS